MPYELRGQGSISRENLEGRQTATSTDSNMAREVNTDCSHTKLKQIKEKQAREHRREERILIGFYGLLHTYLHIQ